MAVTSKRNVAVIGNGLMGSAIARAFARSGRTVVAFDPNVSRARELAAEVPGIAAEETVEAAVRSADLILTCAPTYDAVLKSLEGVDSWSGKILVNTGTSSPEESEAAGAWAAEKGVPYLDAAILCFPQDIGTERAYLLFAGDPEVWTRNEETFAALGPAVRFVSEQVQAASAVDLTVVGGVYTAALAAYVDAIAFARSQGVRGSVLEEVTGRVLVALQDGATEAVRALNSGDFTTSQATLSVFAHGGQTCLEGMRRAGFAANVMEAAVRNLQAAEAAGWGESSFYALAQVSGAEGTGRSSHSEG
ncbi:NAD(P)-dependent oxidoreductase [Streptomyces albidoflavus]